MLGQPVLGQPVLTQSFAEAVAEAERIITGAPHIRTEADLAEGYDYLAGNIRASLQLAWAYQRDFPYFVSLDRPVHQDGAGQPGHPVLPLLPARRRGVRGHRLPRQHRRPELPGDERRLLPGRGAGQPERVRRPGDPDRGRRDVRGAVRPGRRRWAAQLRHARPRCGDAAGPRGLQRLGRPSAAAASPSAGPTAPGARRRCRTPPRSASATAWPARSCCPGCGPSWPSPSGST